MVEERTEDKNIEEGVSDERRVRLYKLNEQGTWDDQFTGKAEIKQLDDEFYLNIVEPESNRVLFSKSLDEMAPYKTQGESILFMSAREYGLDDFGAAFSFVNSTDLEKVVEAITNATCHEVQREVEEAEPNIPLSTELNGLQQAEALLEAEVTTAVYMHRLSRFIGQIAENDVFN